MRVVIGSDHAGFPLKKFVIQAVSALGHQIVDVGVYDEERVDFPDYARKVGHAILSGEAERGIALCGSGIGISIAANKIKGIFASVCHDTYSAHQGVEHDGMNILCLGGRVIGPELAMDIVRSFLAADFIEDERFIRRVNKIHDLEEIISGKNE